MSSAVILNDAWRVKIYPIIQSTTKQRTQEWYFFFPNFSQKISTIFFANLNEKHFKISSSKEYPHNYVLVQKVTAKLFYLTNAHRESNGSTSPRCDIVGRLKWCDVACVLGNYQTSLLFWSLAECQSQIACLWRPKSVNNVINNFLKPKYLNANF